MTHRAAMPDGDAHFAGSRPRGPGPTRGLEGGASTIALLGVLRILVAVVHGHVPEQDHVHQRQPCVQRLTVEELSSAGFFFLGSSSLHLFLVATRCTRLEQVSAAA